MTNEGPRPFSRDELSGLLAALKDPEPAVSIAALRALVRLPVDARVDLDLRPYRAEVERSDYAWSTWVPDAEMRARITVLVGCTPDEESSIARTLVAGSHSPIAQRFAALALEDADPMSHAMLVGAEQLSDEVERQGAVAVPAVDELFTLYRVFLRRACTFWFDWAERQRSTYRPADELPAWFPLDQGPLAAARQVEWMASRVGIATLLRGLHEPLVHGSGTDRFAAAQLVEWARRSEGQPLPRFGGGSGPADVLLTIPPTLQYKKFSPRDLPIAQAPATASAAFTADAEPEPAIDAGSDAAGERRINVWISDPADPGYQPRAGVACVTSFRVGTPVASSRVKGADGAVSDDDIPEAGLWTRWAVIPHHARLEAMADSTVMVPGGTAMFDLLVPRRGDSATVALRVTPQSGDPALRIVITVGGQEYRTLEVSLADGAQTLSDVAAAPLGRTDLNTTHEWTTPRGTLGLLVEDVGRALLSGDIDGEPVELGDSVEIVTDKGTVGPAVANVLKAADDFRKQTEQTRYLNDIDAADLLKRLADFKQQYDWSKLEDLADDAHRSGWAKTRDSKELRELAYYGRELYDTVFPADSSGRELVGRLPPGHRLNISWRQDSKAGWVAHVPWQLLYVGEVGADVPVDAEAFWGLRFRIAYTSYVLRGQSSISLGAPADAACTSLLFFGESAREPATAEAQWQRGQLQSLGSAPRMRVLPDPAAPSGARKQALLRTLAEPERSSEPDVDTVALLYLYCHYGLDAGSNNPILRFGLNAADPDDIVRQPEIGTKALASRPLVFANACATAGTSVYSASAIAKSFFGRGCRAYIGSECMVPTALASRFAITFFHFLLRKPDRDARPIAAGEALAQARLFLWCNYRNVGGLLYSYLNKYDLYLATPAEIEDMKKP